MFCRNCGKDIIGTLEICVNCGASPVNATAFCRFCGGATTAQDVMCPTCGSAIRAFSKSGEAFSNGKPSPPSRVKALLKILIALVIILTYTFLTLPPETVRPIKSVVSDMVLATTGYTSLPLSSIAAFPNEIPPIGNIGEIVVPPSFYVDETQQLTIYAIYKNITTNNATKATRFEDVTAKCTYQSSNDKVATVTSGGLVQAVAPGSANITISYTAAPGSANISSAAQAKVPIAVTVMVPVSVALKSDEAF